jgi:hypothetical protein
MAFDVVKAVEGLKDTISRASDSQDRYSNWMGYFTAALVFVGLVQIGVTLLPYVQEKEEQNARKNCFQSVLQTSDIDKNYKNCLRDHGLSEI